MEEPKAKAEAKYRQAQALIRQAGRIEQAERASLGIPPRQVLRSAPKVGKPGRKGAKARARIARAAKAKGIPWQK